MELLKIDEFEFAEQLGMYVTDPRLAYGACRPYFLSQEESLCRLVQSPPPRVGDDAYMLHLWKRCVILGSFERGIPSLDLVLTQTGFGIVSNNTLSPASRERVDALRSSLRKECGLLACQIIERLWDDLSRLGRVVPVSSLELPSVWRKYTGRDDLAYLDSTPARRAAMRGAVGYLGFSAVRSLLGVCVAGRRLCTEQRVLDAARLLQEYEGNVIEGVVDPYPSLEALVDHMEKHIAYFPEYASSAQRAAKRLRYENSGPSGVYFF